MPKSQPTNPFYVLLLAAGIAFCLTATLYGVLVLRIDRQGRGLLSEPEQQAAQSGPLAWIDRHGNRLFLGELLLLGIGTVGAMAWDSRQQRRSESARTSATAADEQLPDKSTSSA